ncbi:MAG: bifunctional DNA primase/polymerase [Candidatus Paceibacterota bacterium]
MQKKEKISLLLQAALRFQERGLSVIPVKKDKTPFLPFWKEYQTKPASREEIESWFTNTNPEGIAIVTGKISGIVVLDVEHDGDTTGLEIPNTPTVKSGGGGKHYYFKYPEGGMKNTTRIFNRKIDIRGDGGYVVAPPSLHKTGNHYEWEIELDKIPLAEIPEWMTSKKEDSSQQYNDSDRDWNTLFEGVETGSRHDILTRISGKLLYQYPEKDWYTFCLPLIQSWNKNNNPPLEDKHVYEVFESLVESQKQQRKEKKELDSNEERLIKILSVDELLKLETKEQEFLVNPLIPRQGIIALSGQPSHGKSWVMLHIAKAIASGKKVFDHFETVTGKILIFDEESGEGETKRRIERMSFKKDLPIMFSILQHFKIDNRKDLDQLKDIVQQNNISLVMFDPFAALHSKEENSAEQAEQIMEAMQEITKVGASVLFIHHHRKDGIGQPKGAQSLRGSSAISGRLDSHITVKRDKKNVKDFVMEIEHVKSRRSKAATPFSVQLVEAGNNVSIVNYQEVEETKSKKENAKLEILVVLESGSQSKDELQEALKEVSGSRNVVDALKELEKEKKIVVEKQGKKHFYRLIKRDEKVISKENTSVYVPEDIPITNEENEDDPLEI